MMNKGSLRMRLGFYSIGFVRSSEVIMWRSLFWLHNCLHHADCVTGDETGSWTNLDQSRERPSVFSLVGFLYGKTLLNHPRVKRRLLLNILTRMLGH